MQGGSQSSPGCSGCSIAIFVMLIVVVGVGALLAGAAGLIMPNRGLDPMQAVAIEDFAGEPWHGQVQCGEDIHGITANFDRRMRAQEHVRGSITWHEGETYETDIVGSFDVSGTFDGNRLDVGPGWAASLPRGVPYVAFYGALADARIDLEAETIELLQIHGEIYLDVDSCQEFWLARYP